MDWFAGRWKGYSLNRWPKGSCKSPRIETWAIIMALNA
jgi:hypothetical protein